MVRSCSMQCLSLKSVTETRLWYIVDVGSVLKTALALRIVEVGFKGILNVGYVGYGCRVHIQTEGTNTRTYPIGKV